MRLPLQRVCAPSTAAASLPPDHEYALLTHPTVLGRSLRLGARQPRGVSDSRQEYGLILSRAYERLRVSLHHGLRSAPWGINTKTDVQYHHTVESTETKLTFHFAPLTGEACSCDFLPMPAAVPLTFLLQDRKQLHGISRGPSNFG